jgi:transcription elongation factor Elf1
VNSLPSHNHRHLQKTYPFTCPKCGAELNAAPSLSMKTGINSGHATCIRCSTSLHLQINEANDGMTATKWADWLKKHMEATP